MPNLLSFVNKMNEFFINKTNSKWPLASGNCGIFACELSRKLTEFKIDHKIEIYTTDDDVTDYRYSENIDRFIKDTIECDHMVIKINETIIDYRGYSTDRMLRHYMVENWECPEYKIRNINVSESKLHKLLYYSQHVGCGSWMDSYEFENYINEHLRKDNCIL